MENLLQQLRERQEESLGMTEHSVNDRGGEGLTAQPLRKYVSVFRIDGKPILPPLMTSEKRRQMQIFKEKAINIEQSLKERNRLRDETDNDSFVDITRDSSSTSLNYTKGNITQRSQDYYETTQKESEESIMILQDIIRRHSGEEVLNTPQVENNINVARSHWRNEEKIKKLRKSETLIYDNSKNEVIKQVHAMEDPQIQVVGEPVFVHQGRLKELRELERRANLNYVQPKKRSHLLLAGLNDKSGVTIPSICLNPPTPLVGTERFYDQTSDNDSLIVESEIQAHILEDDLSPDESFNSMLTHRKTSTNIPRSNKIHNLKAYNNPSNVSSKIQQFEIISHENSSCNTTPTSSPEKDQNKLEQHNTCLVRSATNPSIKRLLSPTRPRTTPECLQNNKDNTLVRSSSFTLEAPSKVLIEHLRQQRSSGKLTSDFEIILPRPTVVRKISSPSRIQRDTIESKAKRVQKVELKPARTQVQQKIAQNKLAHAAVDAMAPSSSVKNNTNNLYKTKKSPYDTGSFTRTFDKKTKQPKPLHSKSSPNSSNSMFPSQKLNKTAPKPPIKQITSTSSQKPLPNENELLNEMDQMQKEKFLHLLKLQEEEQRKLNQAFQMQQKFLLEQLNKKMIVNQTDGHEETFKNATPTIQRNEELNMELKRFSADSTQNPQSMNEDYTTQSHSLLSNNSILLTDLNTNANPCDHSHVPSLPLSNLSLTDQSNANSSLDTIRGTVSNASPQRMDSLHNTPITTPKRNGINSDGDGGAGGNRFAASSSSSPSSRRRLFVMDNNVPTQSLSNRLMVGAYPSSSRPNDSLSENNHSFSNAKKVPVVIGNNASSRRHPPVIDDYIANAAATTINAYVRGFLIRRLFKTEQIQRIVQTIHDTLIFVLNLHIETCENPSEGNSAANIKLKARLLQQLSSATRTLHLVFFQTTTKERMDIIGRDRKRIRAKLLAMKRQRTPRIAG